MRRLGTSKVPLSYVIFLLFSFSFWAMAPAGVQATANPPILFKTWGGDHADSANGVALGPSNSTYVTGATYSFGNNGSTPEDIFLLKYDAAGKLIWQRGWRGSGQSSATAVASDSIGNVYVTGYTSSFGADIILLKFDRAGNLQWQRIWKGTGYNEASDVAVDNSGNIYVTGTTNYLAGLSGLLQKYDPAGNLLWQRTFGNYCDDEASSVATYGSSSVYVTGFTSCQIPDISILKFNSTGSLVWARSWGNSTAEDLGYGVAVDLLENIYVTGNGLSAAGGGVILKLNSFGDLLWERSWDGIGFNVAANASNIFVTSYSTLTINTGEVLMFSSAGNLISAQTITNVGFPLGGSAIVFSSSGDVYFAGTANGPPPYAFEPKNLTISDPALNLKIPTLQIGAPTLTPKSLSGSSFTPHGNETYSGASDALMMRLGPQPIVQVSIAPFTILLSFTILTVLMHRKILRWENHVHE